MRAGIARLTGLSPTVYLLAIVLLAFGLRAVPLTRQALWWDEGYSVYIASRPASYIISNIVGDHPPGYFLLLHVWTGLTGFSPLAFRMLSVLIGVASVPLMYQVARLLLGTRVGLLSALLLALSPFHIGRSQDARMYPLVILLTLIALYLLIRLLNSLHGGDRQENRILWLGYVVVTAAVLFVHYFAALFVFALMIFVLIQERANTRFVRKWLWANVAIVAALALWLVYRASFIWEYIQEKVRLEKPTSLGFLDYWHEYFATIAEGYFFTGWTIGLVVALVAIGTIMYWSKTRGNSSSLNSLRLCAFLLMLPLLVGFLINLRWPFDYFPRLLSPTLVPLYVLIAAGMDGFRQRFSPLLLAMLLVLLFGALNNLQGYYRQTTDLWGQDYRPLIRDLRSKLLPDDAILVEFPWQKGFLMAYSPELLPRLHYTLEMFPVLHKAATREEAFRSIWITRQDIRDVYLGNGWGPERWLDATEDWWSKTSEADLVKGDLVGWAIWRHQLVPKVYRSFLDDLLERHDRLWYPTFKSSSGIGLEGYLTRQYQKEYQETFGIDRLVLFTLSSRGLDVEALPRVSSP